MLKKSIVKEVRKALERTLLYNSRLDMYYEFVGAISFELKDLEIVTNQKKHEQKFKNQIKRILDC